MTIFLAALAVNGCATVDSPVLLASPNSVSANLVRVIALEEEHEQIYQAYQLAAYMGADIDSVADQIKPLNDRYWIYRGAMDTYLVNGEHDKLVQAAARAEAINEKLKNILRELTTEQEKQMTPNRFEF